MCSAIIIAGGRGTPGGASAARRSAAARMIAKARSLAAKRRIHVDRDSRFEHRRIERGLLAREIEIGLTDALEGGDGVGTPVVPGFRQRRLELLEAALGDAGEQLVAVAEVTVRRGGADAGHARGIGKGKAGRALLPDQVERGLQQRFAQIAVMIAALAALILVFAPAHVKDFYMSWLQKSLVLQVPKRIHMNERNVNRPGSATPA